MPLIESRVRESFLMFSCIVPLGTKGTAERAAMEGMLGEKLDRVVPDLCDAIAQLCMLYPEQFDSILEFIKQSIQYMRGERDEKPEVDMDAKEINEWIQTKMKVFYIQQRKEKEEKEKNDTDSD